MRADAISSVPSKCWRSRLAALTVIALVVFLGHYLRLSSYGFYEDDYWAITPHLTQPLSYILDVLKTSFTYWPTGRPLNHSLPVALSIFGYKLGGPPGIYAIACAWLTVNALLVYAIARRLLSGPSALLAAFAYVLFPADTTKILLTHAAHVQGSMTFLLVGIYLWQRGGFWRWVSYAIAALSLLSYESAFLPFLAVPLLFAGDRKSTRRTWLIHIGLCTLIISLIVAVRLNTGDVRANGVLASPSETARMLLTSLYIGPITSLHMLGKGAWIGLQNCSYSGIRSAVFLLALVWMCRRFLISSPKTGSYPITPVWPHWLGRRRTESDQLPWWWILIVALVMLSGSYALTLTNYPPTQEAGRLTSTHVAAGWGMALAIAALFEGARRNLGKYASWLTAFVCIWVGCLLLYHDYNQREYTRAWSIQKEFWRQVVMLTPEVGSGWTVIVTGNTAEQSTTIASNSWADFHVFSQFFNLGPFANVPAFAHLGVIGHLIRFQQQDGKWQWNPQFWGAPPEPLDRQRLILLHSENGVLSRIPFIDTQAGRLESAAPFTTGPTHPHWPQTTLGQIYFAEAAATP